MILSLLFGVLICFGIPFGILVYQSRRRGKMCLRAFLAGAGCFFLMQVCIRIPLLQNVLSRQPWYLALSFRPFVYGLFLSLTAGLFEEIGRWIFMRLFLSDNRTFSAGLVFGAGHGGIEAVLFTGLGMVGYLFGVSKGAVMPDSALILAAGFERFFAILFHIAASLVVMYGIRYKRSILFLFLAVLLHTLLDLAAVCGQFAGWGILQIEVLVAVLSLITLGFALFIWRKKRK